MVRKLVLTLIAVLGLMTSVSAQNRQVSGTVKDAGGAPVVGATVVVEGTTRGTTTGADGSFVIAAPSNGTLTVSFIGYKSQQVAVNGRTAINISLEEDTTSIDDVIVVAFGTAKKEAFTGSASVVKSDDLAKRQVSNFAQALAGAAAGVQVTSSSGNPTAEPTIVIRGISSISAGTEPLYVVDGVPYSGDKNLINTNDIESLTVLKDAASTALYGARGANGVVMITTKKAKTGEAVVSFDAKVGANARASQLYDYIDDPRQHYEAHYMSLKNYFADNYAKSLVEGGLSAIEARKTVADRAHISANNRIATSLDGGLGYLTYTVPEGEYLIGSNGKFNPNATRGRKVTYNGQDYWLQPDNWKDEAYKTSIRQEYNVSVSASNEKSNFYASMGYLDNNGIVDNSSFTRVSSRLRADYQAKKWLKVGGNFGFTHYKSSYLSDESGTGGSTNVFNFANTMAPIYPVYIRDGEGNIMYDQNGFRVYDYGNGANANSARSHMPNFNALQTIQLDQNRISGNAFMGTAFADFKIFRDLTATINIGANLDEARENSTYNPFYGQWAGESGGRVSVEHDRFFEWNTQQLLNYDHTFGDKHHLHVLVGHEMFKRQSAYLYGTKSQRFSNSNLELNGAVVDSQNAGSYIVDYNTEGFFSRGDYDYDGRIFLSASYRRDGSSRFHPDNCWGNFWSASAAWLIDREAWFNADWVDMLKVKASIGSQGNDNIGNYRYADMYSLENSGGALSVVFDSKGNKNITWETNTNINIGVDFELFKGRLGGTVEYFSRKTTDMLFSFTVAPSNGYTGYYANVGDMRNSGFEIDLHGTLIQKKDFRWNMTLNISHYKNKITYLDPSKKTQTIEGYSGYASGNQFIAEGLSYYTWYIPRYAGVDHETGEAMWWKDVKEPVKDAAGNPVLDENGNAVTQIVGRETTKQYADATDYLLDTSLPDVFGGFTTSFEFYGFDLSAAFAYQIGGKSYDSGYAAAMSPGAGGTVYHRDILNAWTPENPDSNIPRLQYGDSNNNPASRSDRFLLDASYLNLSNITLGYTLPQKWTRKLGISRARVYLACDNVCYWSRRKGFDPRYDYGGSTNYANYSPIRTISGGVNFQF